MRILLAGNTGYITESFITKAFPEYQILIMGNLQIKTDRKKNRISIPTPTDEQQWQEIFTTYDLERVVYFSQYLTFHGLGEGELERLNKILHYCRGEENTEVIYLTGFQAEFGETDDKAVLAKAAEELCQHYRNINLKIKIIRLPSLYRATLEQDYLYQVFQCMDEHQKIVFPGKPQQKIFFLCMDDLAELLYRVLDDRNNTNETLYVPDSFGITFQEFADKLLQLDKSVEIAYTQTAPLQEIPEDDKVIRLRYNWFPRISICVELPELYEQYKRQYRQKDGKRDRLKKWFKKRGKWGPAIELIIGFFLIEILNRILNNSVQFRMIDLRLLFVVLMGSVYGINMGISAAVLESLALIEAYRESGINGLTLFYEPSNWIPFIGYFTVGSICGYIRLKNRDNMKFLKKENELIQEKFLFMRSLYQDTLQDKKQYKKQIIGAQDSFGKIFDITRQLDLIQPQEIFIKSIEVMEDILQNQTISMYSIGKNKSYARLEVASREIARKAAKSIKIADYSAAMEGLEQEDIWMNAELLEGYPTYITGIRRDSELVMLILVQDADYSQMTLYYMNLLKILCGLIGSALLRALDYQEAVHNEMYIEGTHIMKEEKFLERLQLHRSMLEQKIADYTLLRLDRKEKTLEEADEILQSRIRENDILGISTDGALYLILTQTAQDHVPLFIERLREAGIDCKVTSQLGEDYSDR